MGNMLRTFLLLAAMTALLMVIGEYFGGRQGMLIGLGVAAVMNVGSYWFSDKLVLAMYRAREPRGAERRVEVLVADLAERAGLPAPRVMVVDTAVPNAFATGRDPRHAVVAVTTGILGALDEQELTAVLAHELTHVNNRDILIGAVAATLAGAVTMLARMAFWFGALRGDRDRSGFGALAMMILAPVAAMLIQMAISRSREYAADRGAALLTRRPEDLIRALERIQGAVRRRPLAATANAQNTAHLFIVNPFRGGGLASLFSTHPSLEQRAERLRELDRRLRAEA